MDKVLMHVGPVTIKDDILLAGVKNNIGFTSKEFVDAFSTSLKGLREITNAKSYQPFIIPGGGTSAMESITSLLKKGDNVLVVSNGVFGDRWEAILKRYQVNVEVLRPKPGYYVKPDEVKEATEKKHYKLVTFTHVETSTGVREPVGEAVKKVRNDVDITVVDGVSGMGAEEVNAEEWGVDVYISASQKALGSTPGAGLLVLSNKAVEMISDDSVAGYYLNLKNWLPVMRSMEEGKAMYFATPPVHTILQLAQAFDDVRKEGIYNRVKRHSLVSGAIRAGIESMGLRIVAKAPETYSNSVTGVELRNADPKKVMEASITEGIEFAPGVHPAFKYFRIGHMGWVTINDALITIGVLERVLKSIGEEIRLGEGLRAVQEYVENHDNHNPK
jgi:aspartate aminotransferase-like enzyme